MDEIGRFILGEMKRQGISRMELVIRLGYRNMSRGLRALESCIGQGDLRPFVVQNLPKALNVSRAAVEEVVKKTMRQQTEERSAQDPIVFKPHLQVVTEKETADFLMGAIMFGYAERIVELQPGIKSGTWHEQLATVRRVVREHYAASGGIWPLFGKILGYNYVHHHGKACRLDVKGNVLEGWSAPSHMARPCVTVRGRKIPPGLFRGRYTWLSGDGQ